MESRGKASERNAKGRLLEDVVAALHVAPGLSVERNVFLPCAQNLSRRREIDVLLTGDLAGYPVRFAVECKNHMRPIGAPEIDAFVGKLQDVGLPPQCGIYVTAGKFTKGALDRAQQSGVRTLVFVGLAADRLRRSILSAIQSVVYCLPVIASIQIENSVPKEMATPDLITFYNFDDQAILLPDIVWKHWIKGTIPDAIGRQRLELVVPDNVFQEHAGVRVEIKSVAVELDILGLVLRIQGEANHSGLVNPRERALERYKLQVNFEEPVGTTRVEVCSTEEEILALHESGGESVRLLTRTRLPRVRCGPVFWPMSQRVLESIWKRLDELNMKWGEPPDGRLDLCDLEPNLLTDAYNQMVPGYIGDWMPRSPDRTG